MALPARLLALLPPARNPTSLDLPHVAFWLYNLCMPARENAVYVWQCALNSK
jgi:hypothetical protein